MDVFHLMVERSYGKAKHQKSHGGGGGGGGGGGTTTVTHSGGGGNKTKAKPTEAGTSKRQRQAEKKKNKDKTTDEPTRGKFKAPKDFVPGLQETPLYPRDESIEKSGSWCLFQWVLFIHFYNNVLFCHHCNHGTRECKNPANKKTKFLTGCADLFAAIGVKTVEEWLEIRETISLAKIIAKAKKAA